MADATAPDGTPDLAPDNHDPHRDYVPKRQEDPPPPSALDRLVDRLGTPISLVFLVSVCAIVYEVIARYVFHAPTFWSHETTTFLTAIGFIFGGSYCVSRNAHIRIVILYEYVSPKIRRYLDLFGAIACFISTSLLAYAGWAMVQRAVFAPDGSIRLERSGSAWDPIYPALIKIFLFIMLVVIAIQFLIRIRLAWKDRPDA